jgi:hypothetical protein
MRVRIGLCVLWLASTSLVAGASHAAAVTLACGPTPQNRVGNFVHFDEAAGTAGWGTAAEGSRPGGNNAATFSSTEIRWEFTFNGRNTAYTLNRMTGQLDRYITPGGIGTYTLYCAVAQQAF